MDRDAQPKGRIPFYVGLNRLSLCNKHCFWKPLMNAMRKVFIVQLASYDCQLRTLLGSDNLSHCDYHTAANKKE
jgi:hypothetical protein